MVGVRGTAVVILTMGLMFLLLVGFGAVMVVEWSGYSSSAKRAGELLSSKVHEEVRVEREGENTVTVHNLGPEPVALVAALEALGPDFRVRPLSPPVLLVLFENRSIPFPRTLRRAGVLTGKGNVFWEVAE